VAVACSGNLYANARTTCQRFDEDALKKQPSRGPRAWTPTLLLIALLALGLLSLRRYGGAAERAPRSGPSAAQDPSPQRAKARREAAGQPQKAPRADSVCASGAFQRCHEGDVWSEDSCGKLERKLDECGVQLCRDGACEEPDPEACSDPEEGRCDGSTVRLCYAGRAHSVDCGARGLRCRMGDEGAECAPPLDPALRCSGPTRCDAGVLLRCENGELAREDCRAQGAICAALPGERVPSCVRVLSGEPLGPGCDACGCPASAAVEQRCDGQDEDSDGYVDEGLDCGAIPVRAVVVADAQGNSSFSRDEIEAELAQLERLSLQDEEQQPLHFSLQDFALLREPGWLELSAAELQRAVDDPRLHPSSATFTLPLLFTDVLLAEGQVPRAGASTLPNGFCGGSQRGAGPEVGLVAIAKGRSPTTLMHEVGHFLGLCHTHERGAGVANAVRAEAALRVCGGRCVSQGDGLCDTPFDPGPPECSYDAACQTACRDGARPDARNLMSYYTYCRRSFTPEQRRLMEHTLALRRAWHACLNAPCACAFDAGECPLGMGCRPSSAELTRGGRCARAGTQAPGSVCAEHAACAAESLCLQGEGGQGHCVRICAQGSARCTCVATNVGLQVCREDLGAVP
jgi:hypothetical protein